MKNIYLVILFISLYIVNNGYLQAQTVTFNYTGAAQTWTVPSGVYSISVTLKGAQGGGGAQGGLGSSVSHASIPVTPCQILQINVGGSGSCPTGGFNGGGNGQIPSIASNVSCGGGGASDIRTTPYALPNRLIVAAGGGGALRSAQRCVLTLTPLRQSTCVHSSRARASESAPHTHHTPARSTHVRLS